MNNDFGFFRTNMPGTRPADYCLGCLDGAVFIDFDNSDNNRIRLKRISFDGYGCCELKNTAIPMDDINSQTFKKIMEETSFDQSELTSIVKMAISINKELIWEDALKEYDLY